MKRLFTQDEIYKLLQSNPLNVKVEIGDIENLDGNDYIFFDTLQDNLISADNVGMHKKQVQFTVSCKSYDDRKKLVSFLNEHFFGSVTYEHDTKQEYFIAYLKTCIFMYE